MAIASRPRTVSSRTTTSAHEGDAPIVSLASLRADPARRRSGPCGECNARVEARGGQHALTLRPSIQDALPALNRTLAAAERVLGSWDLAWDAVQEALLRLWQEAAAPPNAEAWLYQAVMNRSLHARRTRHRRARHEELAGGQRTGLGEDPRRQVEADDQAVVLEAAIDQLPAKFREALRLRELQGLDYHAIARALEVPVGTVRSRIHRARERLQAQLGHLVHSA